MKTKKESEAYPHSPKVLLFVCVVQQQMEGKPIDSTTTILLLLLLVVVVLKKLTNSSSIYILS